MSGEESDKPSVDTRESMDEVVGSDRRLPTRERLPRWATPVPAVIERIGYRFVWVVVAINLLGTAFGFWYYRYQLAATPVVMWPLIPDSPTATLLIAAALAAWAIGHHSEYLAVLAFFGNFIFGVWTPWVLLVGWEASIAQAGLALHVFLFVSHLGMVVQAMVLHRIAAFRLRAIAVAAAVYGGNLLVDYFLPIVGPTDPSGLFPIRPHYTWLPVAGDTVVGGGATAYQLAAAGAVGALVGALMLAAGTRIVRLRRGHSSPTRNAKREACE